MSAFSQSKSNPELLELQSILNNIDRGFLSVDRNWRIIYINKKASDDIGKKSSELIGKNLWAVFPQIKETAMAKLFQKAMKEGVAVEIEKFGVIANRCFQEKRIQQLMG